MSLKFVNLHGHTGASVYDALGMPKDYAEWMLKNAGEDSGAFAITDHGSMNNIGYQIAAQKQYDKKGTPVNMIYGVEAYFIPDLAGWRKLKDATDEEKKEKKGKKESPESSLVIENEEESKNKKYFNPLNRRNHLVVCAANQTGLSNLFRLVSRSYREGFYRKPRIDINMLRDCNEGLIISTACLAGIPSYAVLGANEGDDINKRLENELGPLMDIFGRDRFFLELQFNRIPEQSIVNRHIIQFAEKTGFHTIATADCHYPHPDLWRDRDIYKLLGWQMQKEDTTEKVKALQEKSLSDIECELYLKNGDQMYAAYEDFFRKDVVHNYTKPEHVDDEAIASVDKLVRESIERTYHIGHDLIEIVYPNDSIKLPKTFQVTETIKTPFDQLKTLCLAALNKRGLATKKAYVDQAVYELKVIKNLGVAEYFLAQKEILDVLRRHMLTGVGRGSGAGSLVCYLLDITFLDPLRHGLLFERFMSPSRAEIPDVDSDVGMKDKAMEILEDHFGAENVLAICNYNRLQLKSLVKDIGKLYEVPFQETNAVTKVMENEAKAPLLEDVGGDQKLYEFNFDGAKKHSPTFQKFLKKYPEVEANISNLYQEVKSIGRHAGGVLVVPDAESCVPIMKIRGVEQSPINEGLTVQHNGFFGLIKFDILGLATLRIIRRCIETILKGWGVENPTIDDVWAFYEDNLHPDAMNMEDENVFKKVYHKGQFPSIFQFTERPVQKFCTKAQPNSVGDISAITALWRPGPLHGGADVRYLGASDRKNKEAFQKEHPIIQRILGETRGNLLYQEQFMILAHELAGFTLEESNKLRKLLVKPAKGLAKEMQLERIEAGKKFITGCISKGLTEDRATKLWEEEILGFISYGFNKSLHFSENVTIYYNEVKKDRRVVEWKEERWPVGRVWHNRNKSLWVKTRDEKTGEDMLAPLKDVHDHGKISVYEFTMDDGRKVKCSKDHKFRVEDGRMLPIWQIMEERLDIVALGVEKKDRQE